MSETTNKTIYEKLAKARLSFHAKPLQKSGYNAFGKWKYFEIGDFAIPAMQSLDENGLCSFVSFGKDEATLTLREYVGDGVIKIKTPMSTVGESTKMQPVQALGAVQTYLRRYLWTALMELVENDNVDNQEQQQPQKRDFRKELFALATKAGITVGVLTTYLEKRNLVGGEEGVIKNWDKAVISLKQDSLKQEQKQSDEIPF